MCSVAIVYLSARLQNFGGCGWHETALVALRKPATGINWVAAGC